MKEGSLKTHKLYKFIYVIFWKKQPRKRPDLWLLGTGDGGVLKMKAHRGTFGDGGSSRTIYIGLAKKFALSLNLFTEQK